MVVLYEPLKALGLPSWNSVGFAVADDIHTVAQKTVPMFACFVLNTPNTDNP